MLEGSRGGSGWYIVAIAAASLVAFAGLLFVRGGNPSSVPLGAPAASRAIGGGVAGGSARPTAAPSTNAARTPAGGSTSGAAASSAKPTSTGAVAAASAKASSARAAARTPRPTRTPAAGAAGAGESAAATAAPAGYRLPSNPQSATVALQNGQGGCPNAATDGAVVETSFSQPSAGRLSVNSPSDHRLSGQVKSDGSFSVSASDPVERWIGSLTATGGTGTYFIVNTGCTEGYETTISFHP